MVYFASRSAQARPHPAWPLLLLAAIMLALGIGWIGYAASDDASYLQGALRWLANPPYAGDDHWTTRFPVILSLAGALALFGTGFAALAITAVAWYLALVAMVGLFAARLGGQRAGWIAAILVATLPVVAAEASTVGCDLAEALFMLGGVWLIAGNSRKDIGWKRPVTAGLCFGTAILCRETAVLALIGFVPLFLLGRPVSRRSLVLMGIAAAGLLLGEMAFQWAMTGDPLRRYALAFNHDSHIDRAANLEGNFLVHPALDPLLVLLVNNDFALLFWLALVALSAGISGKLHIGRKPKFWILATLATSAFLLVALLTTKLVLNPRYFTLPTLLAVVLVALWLAELKPRWRALLLGLAVGSNLLMLSAQNEHPRWPAEALVIAATAHPGEPIFTDPETGQRAQFPLRFTRLTNIHTGAPGKGQLYLAAEDAGAFNGQPIARYPSPPTPLGRALETLGLASLLPPSVAHRLLHPSPTAILWQVGGRDEKKGPADRSAGPL
jgi:4-amino-4-deoxy-L-arabinose transferase-like glycosyltransferase